MLGEYELIVFAQTTHPELAKSFYADVLGLKFQGEDPSNSTAWRIGSK